MQNNPERVIPMLKNIPWERDFPPLLGNDLASNFPLLEAKTITLMWKKNVPQYKRLKWKECYIEQ